MSSKSNKNKSAANKLNSILTNVELQEEHTNMIMEVIAPTNEPITPAMVDPGIAIDTDRTANLSSGNTNFDADLGKHVDLPYAPILDTVSALEEVELLLAYARQAKNQEISAKIAQLGEHAILHHYLGISPLPAEIVAHETVAKELKLMSDFESMSSQYPSEHTVRAILAAYDTLSANMSEDGMISAYQAEIDALTVTGQSLDNLPENIRDLALSGIRVKQAELHAKIDAISANSPKRRLYHLTVSMKLAEIWPKRKTNKASTPKTNSSVGVSPDEFLYFHVNTDRIDDKIAKDYHLVVDSTGYIIGANHAIIKEKSLNCPQGHVAVFSHLGAYMGHVSASQKKGQILGQAAVMCSGGDENTAQGVSNSGVGWFKKLPEELPNFHAVAIVNGKNTEPDMIKVGPAVIAK